MRKYYIFYSDLEKTIIGFNYGSTLKDNYLIIDSNLLSLFEEIFDLDSKENNELKLNLKEKYKYKPTVFFNKFKNINNFIQNINKNNNKRIPQIYNNELKEINENNKSIIDYEIVDSLINKLCIKLKKLPFQLENNGDRDVIIEKIIRILDLNDKSMENTIRKELTSNTTGLTFDKIKKSINKDTNKNNKPIVVKEKVNKSKTKTKTRIKKNINNYGFTNIIFLGVVLTSSVIFAINMALILIK